MFNSDLILKRCSILTPNADATDEDISRGLNELYEDLDKEIIPQAKFIIFESPSMRDAWDKGKFHHLKNFLSCVNGEEIPDFDLIQLDPVDMNLDHMIPLQLIKPLVALPKDIWMQKYNLSFQYTAIRCDLLKRVIKAILKTETLPYVTSTEIMPIAYSKSIGLMRYGVDINTDLNVHFGNELSDEIKNDIMSFHDSYMPITSLSWLLLREYTSCKLT